MSMSRTNAMHWETSQSGECIGDMFGGTTRAASCHEKVGASAFGEGKPSISSVLVLLITDC
jgi:hypothetical protein